MKLIYKEFREDRSSHRRIKERRESNRSHSQKRSEDRGHKRRKFKEMKNSRDEELSKDRSNIDRDYSREREFRYKEDKRRDQKKRHKYNSGDSYSEEYSAKNKRRERDSRERRSHENRRKRERKYPRDYRDPKDYSRHNDNSFQHNKENPIKTDRGSREITNNEDSTYKNKSINKLTKNSKEENKPCDEPKIISKPNSKSSNGKEGESPQPKSILERLNKNRYVVQLNKLTTNFRAKMIDKVSFHLKHKSKIRDTIFI